MSYGWSIFHLVMVNGWSRRKCLSLGGTGIFQRCYRNYGRVSIWHMKVILICKQLYQLCKSSYFGNGSDSSTWTGLFSWIIHKCGHPLRCDADHCVCSSCLADNASPVHFLFVSFVKSTSSQACIEHSLSILLFRVLNAFFWLLCAFSVLQMTYNELQFE